MIGQGEMVNTLSDDLDTMVDDEPTMLSEQGQEIREHTPRRLHPAPAPRGLTLEPAPPPRTPETHTLSGLDFLGHVTPPKSPPAAPTLREAEAAGNTSAVDVEQQLLGDSGGGDGVPDGHLRDVPLADVPLADVPLPDVPFADVPLPDVTLPEARAYDSVGEE
jgi:hypothetical protein